MPCVGDGPQRGWFNRSARLVRMAGRVAGREVRHRVQGTFERSLERIAESEVMTRVDQAKALVETLSQLKGAVMKAGQLLSIDASEFLPPEAMEVLARLQNQAEPVDFAVVQAVLHEDLQERVERLEDLDPKAAAAASIGQVHRARFQGRPVAVKIQYPGIAESIDSDLNALKRVAQSWLKVSGRRIDLDGTFAELAHILHQEADYTQELQNLERYRALVGDDPRFRVPAAHPEVSARRVLTMDWAEGETLHAWIRGGPEASLRLKLAHEVLDLYCQEFFEWGFVQTDPNHGNFLVGPDGRLVLLDLGAAMEYDLEFRRRYVELLKVMAGGDDREIVEAGIAFDLLDAQEGEEVRQLFADLLRAAAAPFAPELQPFHFRDEDYAKRSRSVGMEFVQSLRFSPPPRKLLFLHRKLGGLFNLLKRLDVSLDLHPYWERMIGPPPSAA